MGSGRMTLARVNRDYPITEGAEIDLWAESAARLDAYNRYWRFYKGNHWSYISETGDPVTTMNYSQAFVDKHAEYLFGSGFTIHTNRGGSRNKQAEDLLNENWEAQGEEFLTQFSTVAGVTGDAWINVGYDDDPIFGERIKYTTIPSEFVFPLFNRMSQREPDGILLRWPDRELIGSPNFGTRMRQRMVVRGQYWTKELCWNLTNDKPVGDPLPNILGELPFVHVPNVLNGTDFWGRSDLQTVVDLNREINERVTDVGDIINYHSAPVTILYGAKAGNLTRGHNKIWSGLPKDAKMENLKLEGDLDAANNHIRMLKETLFQLGGMSAIAFGSDAAISNTSGVAIAMQYAPIVEHMKQRRKTFGTGLRKLNWLTLRFMEILGQYRGPAINKYYSFPKWGNPLPRDNQMELNNLQVMHSMQLLARAQILRQLIAHDVAPSDIDPNEVEDVLEQAFEEEVKYTTALAAASAPPPPPGAEDDNQPPNNSVSAADKRSQQQQSDANAAAAR